MKTNQSICEKKWKVLFETTSGKVSIVTIDEEPVEINTYIASHIMICHDAYLASGKGKKVKP